MQAMHGNFYSQTHREAELQGQEKEIEGVQRRRERVSQEGEI